MFSLVAILIVMWAADEYLRMVDARHIRLVERWFLNCCLALPVVSVCLLPELQTLTPSVLITFFIAICYLLYRYKDLADQFNYFCRLTLGVVYIGLLGAHLVLLRYLPDGSSWLIVGTAVTAGSDTGAYFIGKAFGKRKLCPNVSPNKTIEGAVGGVLAGLVAGIGFALIFLPTINWPFVIGSSVFLSLVGIVGDLTESIIKRGTGTKDSGNCLAGHGGILDRIDSLLFVGPVLYYLLVFAGLQ